MLRFRDAERQLELGVHDLVDAGPPMGNLQLAVAWSARLRMKAGVEVHGRYQRDRALEDESFQREVTVRHRLVVRGWEVTISGRIDGLSQEGDTLVVEEVKSTALTAELLDEREADDFPAYVRQVQLYLWFLASKGTPAQGRLILVSLFDGSRRTLPVDSAADIATFVHDQLDWILHGREDRLAWLARRRAVVVPFAHAAWRPGQEELALRVVDTLHQGRHVLLSAPTGYGKTAAVLYAALKVAAAADRRVFFATARTTQQRMAEEAVRAMAARGMPIRAVSIRAREKVCLNEVVSCRAEACRFADGYHDKVRQHELLDRVWGEGAEGAPSVEVVSDHAARAVVCPFALGLDLAARADVVIGDYNYLFDPGVRLALVSQDPSEWIVVVDEAHNLPDRALGYGSPELLLGAVEEGAHALRDSRHADAYREHALLLDEAAEWLRAGLDQIPADARDGEAAFSLEEGLDRRGLAELSQRFEGAALEYTLQKVTRPVFGPGDDDLWMDAARALSRLRAAVERAGEETVVIWRQHPRPPRPGPSRRGPLSLFGRAAVPLQDTITGLKLLCRDPSGLLGPLYQGFFASVAMSATLEPPDFFQAMLGIPAARAAVERMPSPFDPARRRVLVVPTVSTELKRRDRDREATAALISESLAQVPGNAAVFFPSFSFLDSILPLVDLGDRPLLLQDRSMGEAARAELLETLGRGEGHALFAVLGGLFSEGVDLPGDALLAAIIVGPALPAATLERRLLERWFQQRYDEGLRYAWIVPGMSRVVQAAGRVIRTPEDRGAVILLCRRFLLREYQAFFPEDWNPQRTNRPGEALAGFWEPGAREGLTPSPTPVGPP